MKNTFKKILAVALLSILAISALPAQTNPPAGAVLSARDTVELEKRKIEADTELAEKKLEIEKDMASDREGARKMMIHDLAWNSWVLAVVGYILLCGIFRHQRNKMMQETVRSMIEKGLPITPELVTALKSKDRTRSGNDPYGYLVWGLILVAVGIGVLVVAGKAGWIVLLIGVAYLILWAADRNSSGNGQSK